MNGTKEGVFQQIETNLSIFEELEELKKLAEIIKKVSHYDLENSYICALQIFLLYKQNPDEFKNTVKYTEYLYEKESYIDSMSIINSTRFSIVPREIRREGLILEWPKAHEISNGQRDILIFTAMITNVKNKIRKENSILIIDEIFDYLDDANLVALQYHITEFITEMRGKGKNIYPILLTHLDPKHINHFCFNSKNKLKISYLKEGSGTINQHLKKLLEKRDEELIKDKISCYYFHYHPNAIELNDEFGTLQLNTAWSNSNSFTTFIRNEVDKYKQEDINYDPYAICIGLRYHIEEILYSKVENQDNKEKFLQVHGTSKKLEFCEELCIEVPEVFYLLGIIYNESLHVPKNTEPNPRPLSNKLTNTTIMNIILKVFEMRSL